MSIIPGIENAAPERTDTSRGSLGSPSSRPIARSSLATWAVISSSRPSGQPPCMYARQASVDTVNPGGTGNSSTVVISARFAPFPPNNSL